MNEPAIGIDVSKAKLDVCVIRAGKRKSKVFANTPAGHAVLCQWLGERELPATTPVCLEATGPYSEAVALALVEAQWPVSVVNPARVKGFAQSRLSRNKNDRIDARLLAEFAQSAELEPWQPPSPALRELRALVERLEALIAMRQQELNRLEAMAHTAPTSVTQMVRDHVAWLEAQIRRIESDIDDHIGRNPQLKHDAELIRSIPGIGERTAARLLAYLGDVRRFRSAKALAAFIGVTPRQRESGSCLRGRSVLARVGHSGVRRALYMPGLVATRHNPVIVAMKARLKQRGLAPKAIVGASMRRLVHFIYGVITSERPFDPTIPLQGLAIKDGI